MRYGKALFVFICLAAALSIVVGDIHCQSQGKEGARIVSVSVKNNRAISTETILSRAKTRTGEKFSQETANEDLKRL